MVTVTHGRSRAEARARATCNREDDAYFDDLRTYHARYMAAVAQARRRKLARDFDREQDRALARIEFDDYRDYPCRCGRGPKRAAGVTGDELDLSQKVGGDRQTAVRAVAQLAVALTSLKYVASHSDAS